MRYLNYDKNKNFVPYQSNTSPHMVSSSTFSSKVTILMNSGIKGG